MTLSPEEVLSLVTDGGLTLLHRPDWLSGRDMEDLHAANGGCSNAAMRLAPALADEWTWRIGYDNLAEMADLDVTGGMKQAFLQSLTLTTTEGSLHLTGNGTLGAGGMRFRGEARAAEGQEAALSNLLNIIGRREGARSVISIG